MVARRSGSNPRSTLSRRYRLWPSRLAPTSSTIAVASSSTTSLKPRRRQVFPEEPRVPSARPSRSSLNRTRTAGASEKSAVASSARTPAQAATRAFRPTPSRYGIRARMSSEMSPKSSCTALLAKSRPSALPEATRTRASVTNWRISRPFDAPRVLRTASSRLRPSERTSSRLTTLTHAMASSSPAPPSRSKSIGRMSPTITSARATTLAP